MAGRACSGLHGHVERLRNPCEPLTSHVYDAARDYGKRSEAGSDVVAEPADGTPRTQGAAGGQW